MEPDNADSEKMAACWAWLNDRANFASVSIKFNSDHTYRHHYVTWYVKEFGWVHAIGQSFEQAVCNAMATVFNADTGEYSPGKE